MAKYGYVGHGPREANYTPYLTGGFQQGMGMGAQAGMAGYQDAQNQQRQAMANLSAYKVMEQTEPFTEDEGLMNALQEAKKTKMVSPEFLQSLVRQKTDQRDFALKQQEFEMAKRAKWEAHQMGKQKEARSIAEKAAEMERQAQQDLVKMQDRSIGQLQDIKGQLNSSIQMQMGKVPGAMDFTFLQGQEGFDALTGAAGQGNEYAQQLLNNPRIRPQYDLYQAIPEYSEGIMGGTMPANPFEAKARLESGEVMEGFASFPKAQQARFLTELDGEEGVYDSRGSLTQKGQQALLKKMKDHLYGPLNRSSEKSKQTLAGTSFAEANEAARGREQAAALEAMMGGAGGVAGGFASDTMSMMPDLGPLLEKALANKRGNQSAEALFMDRQSMAEQLRAGGQRPPPMDITAGMSGTRF